MKIPGYGDYDVKESNYLTIGATIRFGNAMWKEVSGTLTTSTGDNTPTLVLRCKRQKTSSESKQGGIGEGT